MRTMRVAVLGLVLQITLTTGSAAQSPPFSIQQICKAAIAAMMGRDTATMTARTVGQEVALSYVRADGTTWKYKCKLDANLVLWGSDTGRWRTHANDERVYFKVTGSAGAPRLEVEQKFGDGSSSRKSFAARELGP